jgi:hypothetical protein
MSSSRILVFISTISFIVRLYLVLLINTQTFDGIETKNLCRSAALRGVVEWLLSEEVAPWRGTKRPPRDTPYVRGLVWTELTLLLGSTVGSFTDQSSARSPVTESTIERTNTRLVGPAGTEKPHRPAQGGR